MRKLKNNLKNQNFVFFYFFDLFYIFGKITISTFSTGTAEQKVAARVEEMIAAEGNAKQAIICRFATRPVEPQPIAAPDP